MSDILDHYKTYNQQGSYFLEHFKGSSRHLMFDEWLKTNLKPGAKVLDIGCGDGAFSRWMPEFSWIGLDIGEPKASYNGTWVKQDLESSPYELESGTFDAVVCSEVLEHLFSPEKVNQEAFRLLKSKGIYAISTPNFNWIDQTLMGCHQLIYDPVNATHTKEHIRFYTAETHVRMLEKVGFKVVDIQGADLQWGEFFQGARWELKRSMPDKTDGEVDLLLGKMFRDSCHTIGVLAVKP